MSSVGIRYYAGMVGVAKPAEGCLNFKFITKLSGAKLEKIPKRTWLLSAPHAMARCIARLSPFG